MAPRWHDETALAARHAGWHVVKSDGVDDYQGWGVHLLRRGEFESIAHDAEQEGRLVDAEEIRSQQQQSEWAVLAWSYGSCSGCDPYEGGPADGVCDYSTGGPTGPDSGALAHSVFGDLIEVCQDEESALMKFSERKGW